MTDKTADDEIQITHQVEGKKRNEDSGDRRSRDRDDRGRNSKRWNDRGNSNRQRGPKKRTWDNANKEQTRNNYNNSANSIQGIHNMNNIVGLNPVTTLNNSMTNIGHMPGMNGSVGMMAPQMNSWGASVPQQPGGSGPRAGLVPPPPPPLPPASVGPGPMPPGPIGLPSVGGGMMPSTPPQMAGPMVGGQPTYPMPPSWPHMVPGMQQQPNVPHSQMPTGANNMMMMMGSGGPAGTGMMPPAGVFNQAGLMMNNMPAMNPSLIEKQRKESENSIGGRREMGKGGDGQTSANPASSVPGADILSEKMIGPLKPGEDHPAESASEVKDKESCMQGLVPTVDPYLAAMWGGWVMTPDGQMIRQPIVYTKSVLYPPAPNAPAPNLRERPPGCKTIFIGGVPEAITEEMVRDIFEKFGPIQTVRMSKKNFCHIRYVNESSVECAICISGWRLRIDNSQESHMTGRIHVDFAQARDDQYEYECKQRTLEMEERRRIRQLQDLNRSPSPDPVPHYSEGEAQTVLDFLKSEEHFSKGVETLLTWLARGDCSKRNSATFYSMIQAANTHVKRLLAAQSEYEAELERLKVMYKGKVQIAVTQFGQIESVFGSASHQKVWDHFTRAQRKNIQSWKSQLTDMKKSVATLTVDEDKDQEMEVSEESEDEDEAAKKVQEKKKDKKVEMDPEKLREVSEEWACQANAYRNEVESVRAEMSTELEEKKSQIKILQQTLQGMQKQLLDFQRKKAEEEKEAKKNLKPIIPLYENEARLLSILSTFLHVHPYPVSAEHIWSHLIKIDSNVVKEEVDKVLEKYTDCFSSKGDGAERLWSYRAFAST